MLVWGVRQTGGTPTQLKRARWLFELLNGENAQIVVPAIVLAEFLVPIPEPERFATASRIASRFLVFPFDVACVTIAASLFVWGLEHGKKGRPNVRNVLRSDAYIVATAKIAGVERFYSHDKGCLKMAKSAGMTAFDLPEAPETLFQL